MCLFLYWWRLFDFKLTLVSNKPLANKPLISKKIAVSKKLTIDDLSFIYEHPNEYELDKEMQDLVKDFRIKNNLKLNENYIKEVRLHFIENLNNVALSTSTDLKTIKKI